MAQNFRQTKMRAIGTAATDIPDGSNFDSYDCMVGVSGGKDSTRQALFIRDKLKLNPLLVSLTHPPQTVTKLGVDNLSNLINLGFNVIVSGTSPKTWQKLMRFGFLKDLNYRISTEFALFSSIALLTVLISL